uniref:Uncharacterized protein n=1 Tax=Lutzomyia longipalpis TaxID=7200 RepID=A0A1B0GKU0_LUTLO
MSKKEDFDYYSSSKLKRKTISLEKKREIITRKDAGAKNRDLAEMYGLSRSTISSIFAQKKAIMKNKPALGYSRLSEVRQRKTIVSEMEDMLMVWIIEQQMKGQPNSQEVISNQARILYEQLKASEKHAKSSEEEEEFKASRGWFVGFKNRGGLQKIAIHEGDGNVPVDGKPTKPRVLYIVKPSEIEEDRKLLICPRCSCETKGRKEFIKHLSSHTVDKAPVERKYPKRTPADATVKKTPKPHVEKPKEYPCDICGGRYKFLSSFLKHLQIHEEEAALMREQQATEEDIEQEMEEDVKEDAVSEDPLGIKTESEDEEDAASDEEDTDLQEGSSENFYQVLIKTEKKA